MTERTRRILDLLHDCTPAERQHIRRQLDDWPATPDLAAQIATIQQPPVSDDVLGRFNDLLSKRFGGMLHEDEQREFDRLVKEIETRKAQHWAAIEALAASLGTTPDAVRARYLGDAF